MPFDGNGVYRPVGAPDFPAVAGTTIRSSQYNLQINDIATALTDCLTKDGQSTPTANLPMGAQRHTNVGAAVARTDYARAAEVQDGTYTYLTDVSGTGNDITANAPIGFTALREGQRFALKIASDNTGAVTLTIGGVGSAKSITLPSGADLTSGALLAGSIAEIYYDGTKFQLMGGVEASVVVRRDGTVPMTGALTLAGNATDALHAVPKQQLDAAISSAVAGVNVGVVSFNGRTGDVTLASSDISGYVKTDINANLGVGLVALSLSGVDVPPLGTVAGSNITIGSVPAAGTWRNVSGKNISPTAGGLFQRIA